MRILIVEDDVAGRFLLQQFLGPLGEIQIADNGEAAVEKFRSALEAGVPFDLIFLDIMLPKLNGQDALEKIRMIEKEHGVNKNGAAKVVMTTALSDPNNVLKALHEGQADTYLVKPIENVKMMQELKKIGIVVDG
ncbi:MAG: response regulator [Spirochaetia bacterium]